MMTTARGGGERSHQAAYVPGQPADSRRSPAAACAPAPRAARPTDGDRHRREPPGDERKRKRRPAITQNARKLAIKSVSVRITYNNAHGNRRRDATFLQKWRKNAGRATLRRPSPPVATAARHRWGVVYNPEGRRKAPAALNSPPPTNVPLPVTSRGFYEVMRTMDAATAIYRQVRRWGWF